MPDEKIARALRARIRRDMLHLLCRNEKLSVHEIRDRLNVSESTASRHLKLLYDLGLINFETKAPEKFYFLKIKEIAELLEIYDKIVEIMKNS
ncbi:MAG: metalloregulator ArsR/SmtB family transcription factor [Promethearchaeota archaeon]